MQFLKITVVILLTTFLLNCTSSSSSTVGGTETGTTDSGTVITALSTKVEAVADALIPEVKASFVSASLSSGPLGLTLGSSDDWSTFLEPDNAYIVTDFLGSEDEEPQVVTKIRVLLESFASTLSTITSSDDDFDCTENLVLNEEDTLEIAFYGEIPNGTSENRFFDCQLDNSEDGNTSIYGQDEDGVVRAVTMSDQTSVNTESVEDRGDSVTIRQVVYATYAEQEETVTSSEDGSETAVTAGYLELQYAQATVYVGVDGEVDTDDDVLFKSRSEIIGRSVLDDDGNPTSSTGDFIATKYDKGVNEDDSSWTITTQAIGRGSYDDGDASLLNLTTDLSGLADNSGTFCLEHVADDVPTYAEETDCESLETALPWGDAIFPFSIDPEVAADFEDKVPFEGNDTDLISDSGDNFTIPTYETSEPVES